jgi:ferritin-like protein
MADPDTTTTPEVAQSATEAEPPDELHVYREALEQEYKTKVESSPDNVEKLTHEFFKANAAAAAAQIVYLSQNASSDSVRGSMSKYIVEAAKDEASKNGDPIRDLLKEFTKHDPAAEPAYVEDSP